MFQVQEKAKIGLDPVNIAFLKLIMFSPPATLPHDILEAYKLCEFDFFYSLWHNLTFLYLHHVH